MNCTCFPARTMSRTSEELRVRPGRHHIPPCALRVLALPVITTGAALLELEETQWVITAAGREALREAQREDDCAP